MAKMVLDSLFERSDAASSSEQSTPTESAANVIAHLQLDELIPFPVHPFKPYTDDKLKELSASIERCGIITPITVRPFEGNFQIIAGHNRSAAARQAGLSVVPCIIHDVDDETAELEMVESNLLQREHLLPSEKAYAYKMQYDALLKLKKRGQSDHGGRIADHMASFSSDSEKQIRRFISLTKLIPEFLEGVDTESVPFLSGVALSYISTENQLVVHDYMQSHKLKLDNKTAEKIKEIAEIKPITDEILSSLFCIDKPPKPLKEIKVSFKRIKQYFPPNTKERDIESVIIKALEAYFEKGGV